MKFAIEFVKTALLLCVWPVMVVESWGAIPKSERGDFAGTLNWIAVITLVLVWLTYYFDTLWLKVPFGLITIIFHVLCGLFVAFGLLIVGTPNYEDY